MRAEAPLHLVTTAPSFTGLREPIGTKEGNIVYGPDVVKLPLITKLRLSRQISQELAKNPTTMRQLTSEQILTSMQAERFVVELGEHHELLACAQAWPLEQNPSIVEVGTWLSFQRNEELRAYKKGAARRVLEGAAKLGKSYPQAEIVIALVQDRNIGAQDRMKEADGVMIGYRNSDYVTVDGEPALMQVFNLINLVEA